MVRSRRKTLGKFESCQVLIAPKVRKLFMIAIAIARSDVAEKGKQLDTTVRSEESEKGKKNVRSRTKKRRTKNEERTKKQKKKRTKPQACNAASVLEYQILYLCRVTGTALHSASSLQRRQRSSVLCCLLWRLDHDGEAQGRGRAFRRADPMGYTSEQYQAVPSG